jgi:peroxiredoxin
MATPRARFTSIDNFLPLLKKRFNIIIGTKEMPMKQRMIIIGLVVSFLLVLANADQKESMRDIYRLFSEKKYEEALKAVDNALKAGEKDKDLLKLKFNILLQMEKYDAALAVINEEIKKKGENEELLSAMYSVYFRQGKLKEALEIALKKDKLAKKKSPWDCMSIMHVHLRMGNKAEALDWLQEAVSRGFISYRILSGKRYRLLAKEKRFYDIIETIKVAIGLGDKAKDFTVKLLDGNEFTLAQQKGKVVLVDFWATWCDSCREELPSLKALYTEFKEKDFEIISISLDSSEKILKDFIKKESMDWKMSFSGQGWEDATVKRYGVNSIPSYWLIDKKGFLRSFGLKGKKLHAAVTSLTAE